jgi:hypothetical protein
MSYNPLSDYRSVVEKWGSCHIEIYDDLLRNILTWEDLLVENCSWTGEINCNNKIYYCEIKSPKLSPGYHGVMNIVIDWEELYYYLKKNLDT